MAGLAVLDPHCVPVHLRTLVTSISPVCDNGNRGDARVGAT